LRVVQEWTQTREYTRDDSAPNDSGVTGRSIAAPQHRVGATGAIASKHH